MNLFSEIEKYTPENDQERQDKKVIMSYIKQFPDTVLTRENEYAHITSSGFIMNRELDKVLMVHHNIRNAWSWTGGHVDGETDFLRVALKEAREETGVKNLTPLARRIASLDVLPVPGHRKNGKYVSAHLHLSVAYILIASEQEGLTVKKDENSGVSWFSVDRFTGEHFSLHDVYLYGKLVQRAKYLSHQDGCQKTCI